jgi:hypothetical protein
MLIRTRLGLSVDGFIATPDGLPAFLAMPDFVPHSSYDWQQFNEQIDAVVMGRVPLDAGLESGDWPWPGKQIYVLTSRPVPPGNPAVAAAARSAKRLSRRHPPQRLHARVTARRRHRRSLSVTGRSRPRRHACAFRARSGARAHPATGARRGG